MDGAIKEIKINSIINYFENPRHAIGATEEDTLKKLFEAVGNQYMLNLASDIQKHGLLGSQQVVVVFSEEMKKYVVYEGNRRVAAIKMLLHPEKFTFLDKPTIDKAKKIAQEGETPNTLKCYVTDEAEAMFIMERVHSGEDKGRGVKQWTSREKEIFKVRRSHEQKKNLSYLIDLYVKKYCDGLDITTILPFTTIQRLFNNAGVRKQIGLDVANERSFTPDKMEMVVAASKWACSEAEEQGTAVTRLFDTSKAIEERLLPWIQEYMRVNGLVAAITETVPNPMVDNLLAEPSEQEKPDAKEDVSNQHQPSEGSNNAPDLNSTGQSISDDATVGSLSNTELDSPATPVGSGSNKNLPYFFQGLQYGDLDPNDPDAHGVAAVCRELQLFSDKKLVAAYPIASTFLVRSLIEQTIMYYSKKHDIQGTNKKIWNEVNNISKLSGVIGRYKRCLPNYITDSAMQQYFTNLFGDYEKTIDPLNWVVHRPAEFQLDPNTLIDLPRKGLLALINYMLSSS